MILTVTPNTALDRVLFVRDPELGTRNRVDRVWEGIGCKGCDAAVFVRQMGEPASATGFAAGAAGRRLEALLNDAGVPTDFVWTGGETRTNTVVVGGRAGSVTTFCAPGLEVRDGDYASLHHAIRRGAGAGAILFGGSLPDGADPGRLGAMVATACECAAAVVVDAAGDCLREALSSGATAIAPNRSELEALTGTLADRRDAARAASRLAAEHGAWVLVTLGRDGALLADGRRVCSADGLEVRVASPAGAGDAVTAVLGVGIVRDWPPEEILRTAVAAGAAAAMCDGTTEMRVELLDELTRRVRVEELSA